MLAGESHPLAKLTRDDVIAIRAATGQTQKQIANQFGVSVGQVAKIRKRLRWGDDGQPPATEKMSRKLSPTAVAEIIAATGVTHRELAERYGVSRGRVTTIRLGKRS